MNVVCKGCTKDKLLMIRLLQLLFGSRHRCTAVKGHLTIHSLKNTLFIIVGIKTQNGQLI